LPIDHFCDMFRTMTNVTGHLSGAVVVSATEALHAASGSGSHPKM